MLRTRAVINSAHTDLQRSTKARINRGNAAERRSPSFIFYVSLSSDMDPINTDELFLHSKVIEKCAARATAHVLEP